MRSLNITLMFPLMSPLVHKQLEKKGGMFLIYVLTKLLRSYKIQSRFLVQTPNNLPIPGGLYSMEMEDIKLLGIALPM